MAALIAAALGFGSGPKPEEAPLEMPLEMPSTDPSPTRNATYFEKVANDIVAAAPIFGKARVPIIAGHRDKESLMCEIINLKKALEETELHLHMHKQHYLKSLEESRKLEREVEELELRGNFDAPRTGGVVRLESRFKERLEFAAFFAKGLECSVAYKLLPSGPLHPTDSYALDVPHSTRNYRCTICIRLFTVLRMTYDSAIRYAGLTAQIDVLEDIVAERKYGELAQLRKDLGTTHTREIEVERDTLAGEIARLKIYLNHMRLLNEEAKEDNGNLKFCKRQFGRLLAANPKVREFIEVQKVAIQRVRNEIEQLNREGVDLMERMKDLAEEDKKFDKKLEVLEPAAKAAVRETRNVARQQNQLGYDRMVFNKDFREKHPGALLA